MQLPRLKIVFTSVLFIATIFMLSGCISDPKMTELEDTLRAYDRAIRWSDYRLVPAFRSKEKVNEKLALDTLKFIRVTGYTKKQFSVAETGDEVNQMVEIRYYDENFAKEKIVIDKQKWIYDFDLDRWVLASDLPDFFYNRN